MKKAFRNLFIITFLPLCLSACDLIENLFETKSRFVHNKEDCESEASLFTFNLQHINDMNGLLKLKQGGKLYKNKFAGESTLLFCSVEQTIDHIQITWAEGLQSELVAIDINTPTINLYYPKQSQKLRKELQQAKAKVLRYFEHIELDPNGILGMARLTDMYKLPYQKNYIKLYEEIISKESDINKARLRMYQRIIDPDMDKHVDAVLGNESLKQIPVSLQTVDSFTMPALYCKARPMPDDVVSQWMRLAEYGGGHGLTHAVLAYRWAEENGCDLKEVPEGFIDRMLVKLVSLVDSTDGFEDGEVEVLTWASWFDRVHLLPPELIKALLDHQLESGGWKADPRMKEANQHTSVLALWLFLDLLNDGKRYDTFAAQKT